MSVVKTFTVLSLSLYLCDVQKKNEGGKVGERRKLVKKNWHEGVNSRVYDVILFALYYNTYVLLYTALDIRPQDLKILLPHTTNKEEKPMKCWDIYYIHHMCTIHRFYSVVKSWTIFCKNELDVITIARTWTRIGIAAFDTVLAQSPANEFQTDGIDVLVCAAAPIET